jgi:type I restriction enzyme S subunit
MSKWQTAKLGDLLTLRRDRVELLFGTTYKRITVKIGGLGVVLRDEVDGSAIKSEVQFIARAGQFVASKIDARNGSFGLVPPHLDGSVVSGNFLTFDCNPDRLFPKFIEYYANRPTFWEQCSQISEGTTNRVPVRVGQFMELPIELPPLAEQRRVVARIEELAVQIHEARTLRHQATEEAEALVLSALKHLRLPPGTVDKPINACSTMSTGTTPPSDRSDYYGGPIQWYTPGDLEYQQRLGASSRTLSEVALAERKARMFEPGTVLLVAIGGSLGKVALTHERCSANQQITGIKFSDEVIPEYGFWWMRRLGKDLMAAAPQATLPIINQERIGVFEISVPPLPEQRRIVAELDALQAEVDALKRLQGETAAESDALLPAILDRAFKGEL